MILLPKTDYPKVAKPLAEIEINTLFAQDVVSEKVDGKIYVNSIDEPTTFYIVHPYGMTLLIGNSENENFNKNFKEYSLNKNNARSNFEWMQAYPNNWDKTLEKLYNDCSIKVKENTNSLEKGIIEINTRVNFKFNYNKHRPLKNIVLSPKIEIKRTDNSIFDEMKGSVIPEYFWKNADDFLENGVGFSLFYENQLVSTAFSSCMIGNQLELGIETIPEFRGKGFAELVCLALIDYAIENNFEPIWACRLENRGSYKLAEKIGFENAKELPYYRLSN